MTHRHQQPPRRNRAFTLIELVTVAAIIGIVGVAVTGASMSNIDNMRARAAAGRLTSDIRYAQRAALASRLRTWIVFNVGNGSYQLFAEDAANPGKANRQPLVSPLDQSSDPVQFGTGLFTGVTIQSANIAGTAEIEFDSFGEPYDGNSAALTGNGVISLSTGVTITVRAISGFVDRAG